MAVNGLPMFLISLLLALISTVILKRLALKYNILAPKGIPLVGGIAIGLSFGITCLLGIYFFRNLPIGTIGLLSASAIMLIFGIIDDRRELSVWVKFLLQVVAVALLISFGIRTRIIFIGYALNVAVTFIWMLAITNAFNHLDVLDGVAGISAAVVCLSFLFVSVFSGSMHIVVLSAALLGCICGFLIFNMPPAKIYLGNSGSHFLGFLLAAIALWISYAPLDRKVALLAPLFILGLPIFDTFFLIWIRLKNKRAPYHKSNDHISLRLRKIGYSKNKALLTMFILGFMFSLSGVIISQAPNRIGALVAGLTVFTSLILAFKIGKIPIDG